MTLLRRIPALLLAVTLALAVGIVPAPTLLLAAPAAQAVNVASLGYYESDLIPGGEGNPDLVVGLNLNEDGTAEVISDYQTEEDAIVEVGTWVDNGDGTLTLTVTGTTDGDYAAPIALVFNIADDGALVVPGAENGAFGPAGLVLNPTGLGNREAILAQIPENSLVFESDVLPAASGPGLQLTLAVFDDGSLLLVSDYLTAGEIVVETGTWTESEEGSLLVTLTGQLPEGDGDVLEYEAPLEFVFTVNDDNSLSLVDEGGALFGDEGLTLVPTEATGEAMEAVPVEEEVAAEATPEATEEAVVEATPEATPEPTEEVPAEEEVVADATPAPEEEADAAETEDATTEDAAAETITTITIPSDISGTMPSGVYISDLLPGAAGSSTFLVTVFYTDGSIIFSTYPLNGEPPVTEVGTWVDNGDGTYLIIATGTLDEEYDPPFEIDFTLTEEGVVNISGVDLYPLAEIDLAGAPMLVSTFASDLITDTIDLAHTLTLMVYDDDSVELATDYLAGDEPLVTVGTWMLDEINDELIITLTGDDDGDFDEPIEWVFAILADGTLSLANDDAGYYGDDGLLLLAVDADAAMMDDAASGEDATPEDVTEVDISAADDTDADDTATDEGVDTVDADTTDADSEETDAVEADAEEADTEESSTEDATLDEADPEDDDATGETTTGGEAADAEGAQLFQSEVLPAAFGPGLQLTLGLLDDGRAAIDYDYLNGDEIITNTGEWVDNDDGTLTITFTEGPNGTLELPVEMVFELDADGNLVIIDASEESSGLIDTVLTPVVLE